MYKLCWEYKGNKETKSFPNLDSIYKYLENFVYNGEWIELYGDKLNIDLEQYTAKQMNLFA